MKILLIFTVCFISAQMSRVDCEDVTGYGGGSVLINCYYNFQNNMNHTKYFCKLNNRDACIEKFLSNKPTAPNPDQKIFPMDDNQPGLFSVLIKNISNQDEGTYRCGVENEKKITDVKLEVKEDVCCGKSFPHEADPGETVTFTCKYPAKFQHYPKYLYKVTDHSSHVVIYTLGSPTRDGRFSISDHEEENLFNVSISDVTVEDAGVYLCGAQEIKNGNRKPYFSLFNEMQLQVTRKNQSTPSTPDLPGTSGTIIAVSVCVVLLLIGGVALIFYKLRQIKTQDSESASSTRRNSVNSEEAQQGPYYEEIPDAHPSSSTVYATAQKPKSPSKTQTAVEPPTDFYSMAQLSNPATGSSAEYATVDECT